MHICLAADKIDKAKDLFKKSEEDMNNIKQSLLQLTDESGCGDTSLSNAFAEYDAYVCYLVRVLAIKNRSTVVLIFFITLQFVSFMLNVYASF